MKRIFNFFLTFFNFFFFNLFSWDFWVGFLLVFTLFVLAYGEEQLLIFFLDLTRFFFFPSFWQHQPECKIGISIISCNKSREIHVKLFCSVISFIAFDMWCVSIGIKGKSLFCFSLSWPTSRKPQIVLSNFFGKANSYFT